MDTTRYPKIVNVLIEKELEGGRSNDSLILFKTEVSPCFSKIKQT